MPAALKNLVRIGQLVEHDTDAAQVGRMLEAIQQNIADGRTDAVSAETRFEAAYRAITQCAMVALWANGYRPSKSTPGHHMTLIQSLPASIGVDVDQMRLLDTFRVKRNAIDYSGEAVDGESLAACIEAADDLAKRLQQWLTVNRSDLTGG
jgi:hypothetical protein